jgi:hypothetical protein
MTLCGHWKMIQLILKKREAKKHSATALRNFFDRCGSS